MFGPSLLRPSFSGLHPARPGVCPSAGLLSCWSCESLGSGLGGRPLASGTPPGPAGQVSDQHPLLRRRGEVFLHPRTLKVLRIGVYAILPDSNENGVPCHEKKVSYFSRFSHLQLLAFHMNFECLDMKYSEDYLLDVRVVFVLHTLYNLDTRIKVTPLFIADLLGVRPEILNVWLASSGDQYVFVQNMIRSDVSIPAELIEKLRGQNEERHLRSKQLFARLRKEHRRR